MQTFQTPDGLRRASDGWRSDGLTVGLVPTMGALHEGHLSLVRRAASECDRVVASIFVNPTQFAAGEDFEKYPRDIEGDGRMLAGAGCDAVFTPTTEAMYGESGSDLGSGRRSYVEVGDVATILEGEDRPEHFRGVATVVTMLLLAGRPDRAYFGEKDYQQLQVIRKVARELLVGSEIVGCPIVREPDGLALSSRNAYLSEKERKAATVIHRALQAGRKLAESGVRDAKKISPEMEEVLRTEPLVEPRYVAVVDAETLAPLDDLGARPARALVAAKVGRTRLIDNLPLQTP
ncbi:pantoate--beta-alanine ligase [Rubrobacter indicoceani]|uniref:pantoate--beta-alanine ligase n=1 Tax=Rubrobacter indicoceani TaxID=2051957 RepID=UPI000E5C221D|nr:pantoate--beta-alanine ligase [Rubrobacter indicoceani]